MARAPYNVLVIPYYKGDSGMEYCIFKRRDMGIWQFIAGGGEDNEEPVQAAARESDEEAHISAGSEFRPLFTMGYVPANCFSKKAQTIWGPSMIVVPVYCFAVEMACKDIKISQEHTSYQWAPYEPAYALLHFDTDKTALYEVKVRLQRKVW